MCWRFQKLCKVDCRWQHDIPRYDFPLHSCAERTTKFLKLVHASGGTTTQELIKRLSLDAETNILDSANSRGLLNATDSLVAGQNVTSHSAFYKAFTSAI